MSSFPSLNSSAQTGLIPTNILGYANNGDSAIQVDATTIKIGGNLTTTPNIVEISAQNGLTTSRPQGLNIQCDLDMNLKSITNVAELTRLDGGDLYLITQDGGNVVLSNIGTGGSIHLNALDNIHLSGSIINSFGDIDMNDNSILKLQNITTGLSGTTPLVIDYGTGGGFTITDNNNTCGFKSNSNGLLTMYAATGSVGGFLIENNNNSGMQFTEGIYILDGYNNSFITNNTTGITINNDNINTGITLNSNTSITLNAPTISIPNLVVTIPSDLTLNSLTYSSGIDIQDNIHNCSITSYNGTINNSTMDINVNNGDSYTQLNILSNNIVTSANFIFQNGIRIMDSLSESAPNITGDGNALQFTSQEIIFNTPQTYISSIQSNTGTLSLTSFSVTASTLNLVTTNGGTINLTASQVNMTSANASCNQVILAEQTSLPTGQAGSICYHNDSYYVYKVIGGWTLLI